MTDRNLLSLKLAAAQAWESKGMRRINVVCSFFPLPDHYVLVVSGQCQCGRRIGQSLRLTPQQVEILGSNPDTVTKMYEILADARLNHESTPS